MCNRFRFLQGRRIAPPKSVHGTVTATNFIAKTNTSGYTTPIHFTAKNDAYPNAGISLFVDQEGANIRLKSTTENLYYEIDTLNSGLRLYQYSNGKITTLASLSDTALNISGNAKTATKLATARTIQTNLSSAASASFDGSANITPGITGTLPVANGGTGQTTENAAANAFINSLPTGTSTPTDETYYISQYVGDEESKTTRYYRRPLSALLDYVQSGSRHKVTTGSVTLSNQTGSFILFENGDFPSGGAYSGLFFIQAYYGGSYVLAWLGFITFGYPTVTSIWQSDSNISVSAKSSSEIEVSVSIPAASLPTLTYSVHVLY